MSIDKVVNDMRRCSEFFKGEYSKESKETANNYIKICIEEYIPKRFHDAYNSLWKKMKEEK